MGEVCFTYSKGCTSAGSEMIDSKIYGRIGDNQR